MNMNSDMPNTMFVNSDTVSAMPSTVLDAPSVVSDDQLAAQLATAAGEVLLATRTSGLFAGRGLGTAGDGIAQELLRRALETMRPDDAVLSEEAADDLGRLDARRVWIVDPLDGTREFGEGRSDWAVHVALVVDGAPGPAAVALPGLGTVWSTAELAAGMPASRVDKSAERRLRVAVSRSRPPAEAELVAERLGAELVPMGSAGYKTMAVVCGEVDAYVHSGGQYEWDSAAPVGVALAAGLHASRIDGSPLTYNRPDPLLPDLLVCRSELADLFLRVLTSEGPPMREEM